MVSEIGCPCSMRACRRQSFPSTVQSMEPLQERCDQHHSGPSRGSPPTHQLRPWPGALRPCGTCATVTLTSSSFCRKLRTYAVLPTALGALESNTDSSCSRNKEAGPVGFAINFQQFGPGGVLIGYSKGDRYTTPYACSNVRGAESFGCNCCNGPQTRNHSLQAVVTPSGCVQSYYVQRRMPTGLLI